MKLEVVEMTNWRPFYGSHTIECETKPDRPYVWIHGNNMRGKTAILNAIRWCLYGHTEDSGRQRASYLNLNKRAMSERDFVYSVKLSFRHAGSKYVLERHAQWSHEPTSDAGKDERSDLRIDAIIQPGDDIDRRIREVLHEEISQFYLFDGELIREYENQLSSGEGAAFIRGAIERIVGLPAVKRGARDLQEIAARAEKEVNKHLRKAKAHEKLSEDLERIRVSLETVVEDIEKLADQEEELAGVVAQLAADLRRFESVMDRLRERDLLSDQQEALGDDRDDLVLKLSDGLRDQWWFPAVDGIQARRDSIENLREQAVSQQVQNGLASKRIDELTDSIESKCCDLCGQTISEDHRRKVRDEIDRLSADLGESEAGPDEADLALLTSLRSFRSAQPELLFDRSRQISKIEVELFKLKTRIADIDEELRGVERETVAETQRDLDAAKQDLKAVRDRKEIQIETQSALEAQRREKRRNLPSIPGSERILEKLSLLTELADTFQEAIARFRESVREDVAQSAQKLFRALTTEPEFKGIAISDNYAITILDSDGAPVQPSSAAQQVAALSLIGGLKRAAVREGPLVLDTPLARFDIEHRDRILDNLTLAGDQIILLLQPGEFDRDRYIDRVGDRVAREYTIERVSDQESRIVRGYDQQALNR